MDIVEEVSQDDESERKRYEETIDDILKRYLPYEKLIEVNRLLYGSSIRMIEEKTGPENLEVKFCTVYGTIPEQLRRPRLVRVGLIQHSIVLPPSEPIDTQRNSIHDKISRYIAYAASHYVNIICLQEAWSTQVKIL